MAGRKPLPDKVKELRGTDQPCRINSDSPDFEVLSELPKSPSVLGKEAKSIYRKTGQQLVNLELLTLANIESFVAYCSEYGTYYKMIEDLKEEGEVVEEITKLGSKYVVNPKRKIAEAVLKSALKLGTEFGLTPSSKGNISIGSKSGESEIEQLLNFLRS